MAARTRGSGSNDLADASLALQLRSDASIRDVQALQRSAGNRATAARMQPAVQRRLAFAESDLTGHVSRRSKATRLITRHQSTFGKMKMALRGYWSTNRAGEQAANVHILAVLSERWLKAPHSDASARAKRDAVKRLRAAAYAEYARSQKQAAYMERLDAAEADAKTRGGLDFLSNEGTAAIRSTRKNVAGETDGKYVTQKAIDLARKYGLNDAEIAAIRIYSVGDYKYINPVTERSDAWLKSQLPEIKTNVKRGVAIGPKEMNRAKTEGRMHASMLKKAMKRMPDADVKEVFRGQTLDAATVAKRYKKGSEIKFDYFASTSGTRSVSESFIETGLAEAKDKGENKVGVLLVLEGVKGGKRIADFSENAHEDETLLLPGARYVVTSVRQRTNYIRVRAKQTAAGGTKH